MRVKELTTMLRHPRLLLAGLALAAGGTVLGTHVLPTSGSAPAPVDETAPLTVRDASGQIALTIQAGLGRPDTGRFDLLITSTGDYTGTATVTGSGQSSTEQVRASDVTVQLYPAGGGATSSTTLSMTGELDTATVSASVEVWIGGTHYHLGTASVSERQAAKAASAALAAIKAENWAALYAMMSSDTTSAATEAQFTAELSAETPGTVTAATLTGTGSISTDTTGYPLAREPFTATLRRTDGSTLSYRGSVYLVWEQSAWHVLATDPPPSS